MTRTDGIAEPLAGYAEMIETASGQLAALLDELSLAARIERGRYEPRLEDVNTADLARAAAEHLGAERVGVSGEGGVVLVDPEPTRRAVAALVRCALRHGGLEHVDAVADQQEIRVFPITAASAPVVLGDDLRDLGAAVAVRLIERLGGSVAVEDGTLHVRLAADAL